MHYGDSFFGLAHYYAQDLEYRKYFLNLRNSHPDAFITMDCGSAENSTVTEQVLLDIVEELKPNEVIAPDILFDKEQTLKNLYYFTVKMIDFGFIKHTNIFGCPQGKTKQEWLECYYLMMINPMVSTIGLSKIAVPKCWNNAEGDTQIGLSRNQCVQELKDRDWLQKPLHLLGMGEHTEFDYYLQHRTPCIRSSDSCYTILATFNGISFRRGDTTRIPTTNDYFNRTLDGGRIITAIDNIDYLKAKYEDV
tara:strand:- start:1265 stop:2014 length:750 start_codon:yes stop_codon:yes gene_type:complete